MAKVGTVQSDKAPDAFRTISEVAEELDVPQHVLRFWETRFPQIKPMKRGGGRRYYRPDDVDLVRGIRRLLYGEGYTIRGVQRILKDSGVKFVQSVWRSGAPQPPPPRVEDKDRGEDEVAEAAGEPAMRRPTRGPAAMIKQAAGLAGSRQTPTVAPASEAARRGAPARPAVTAPTAARQSSAASSQHLHGLQAALAELAECRRLLDAALKDAE